MDDLNIPNQESGKRCSACGQTKPLTGFNKNKCTSDGLQSACRVCQRKRQARYGATAAGKETLARYKRTAKGRKVNIKANYKLRASNPVKRIAWDKTKYAIRAGKLKRQPCEVCNAEKTEAHHEDYAKPLDVRWLCRKHHLQRHKEMRT